MALDAKVGSFNITTGTSDVAITGVGFTPKFVMFWWSGGTSSSDEIAGTDIRFGQGFVAGTADQHAHGIISQDGVSTMTAARCMHNAAAVVTVDTAGTFDGRASLKSFDADGFTLQIDDAFPVDLRIHYLALGGASLVNATTGTFALATSTGTVDYTGHGFDGNLALFAVNQEPAGLPADDAGPVDPIFGWSCADGSVVSRVKLSDDTANQSCSSYQFAGECIVHGTFNALTWRATLSAFITGGFRLNWLEASTSPPRAIYAFLSVEDVATGSVNTRTDGADIAETGVGFKPAALVFAGQGRAQNTQDTVDNTSNGRQSIGAASSPTARAAAAFGSEDASANAVNEIVTEHDAVYAVSNLSGSVEAVMDLKSLDSDGFTCVMDDPAPSATPVYYLALGPAAGGGFVPFPPQMWRSGFGRDPHAGRPVASRRRRRRSA